MYKALYFSGNSLLLQYLILHIRNSIIIFDVKSYSFSRKCFYYKLHRSDKIDFRYYKNKYQIFFQLKLIVLDHTGIYRFLIPKTQFLLFIYVQNDDHLLSDVKFTEFETSCVLTHCLLVFVSINHLYIARMHRVIIFVIVITLSSKSFCDVTVGLPNFAADAATYTAPCPTLEGAESVWTPVNTTHNNLYPKRISFEYNQNGYYYHLFVFWHVCLIKCSEVESNT